MATVFSPMPFQLGLFDLSALWNTGPQRTLGDNVFYASDAPPPSTYEDIFRLEDPGSDLHTLLAGTGLVADASGQLSGGTLQALIGERATPGGGAPEVLWSITGLAADAAVWQAAMLTPTQDDDSAALRAALSGDDLFELGDTPGDTGIRGHFVYGGDGNDTLRGSSEHDTLAGGWGSGSSADGNDSIAGNGGADNLFGQNGDDTLEGGDGNDSLDGGTGTNRLVGGNGNDLYLLTTEPGVQDIVEQAGGGIDTVWSRASHVLAPEVENLSMLVGGYSGTGNAVANTIEGNFDANLLEGGGGNDTMAGFGGMDTLVGGAGNDVLAGEFLYPLDTSPPVCEALNDDTLIGGVGDDTYHVSTNDRIEERGGEGTDTAITVSTYVLADEVEVLRLAGTRGIAGTGNAGDNTIIGNAGANRIDGGAGSDTLTGGGSSDFFSFSAAPDGDVDRITDFVAGGDRIGIDAASFATDVAGGFAAAQFGTGPQALTAEQRIVYDPATGLIGWDGDGSGPGALLLFAQVDAGTALTAADFVSI